MKKLAITFAAAAVSAAAFAQVEVTVFDDYNDNGSGITFSNPVGAFSAPQIDFATTTGYNWHPYGRDVFGAIITGCMTASVTGDYQFGLESDDGSYLFLNNVLNVNNGGGHGPSFVAGTPVHMDAFVSLPFEVQFFEDFGGESGVDMKMLQGTEWVNVPASMFVCVPEPTTLAVFGVAGIGLLLRRRRK